MTRFILASLMAGALALPALAADYTILAPAAPGGGWDQTARTMQEVLRSEGISDSVQVQNVPGAGGTVGLAQFVASAAGDPSQLIVGGYVMVGAILTNGSPVGLDDVTPVARLTGEYEAIVVPASSPIQTVGELVDQLKADPGAVSWAGDRRAAPTISRWGCWPRRPGSIRRRSTTSPFRAAARRWRRSSAAR